MSTFAWFTSDLHLGHHLAAEKRGFSSISEHDSTIIENINASVSKRDKLFILGDLAFSLPSLSLVNDLKCRNIELILGNHDKFALAKYRGVVQKIHGFRGYNSYWLSHCPIHPEEISFRKKGNIHGHIHQGTEASKAFNDPKYINVNIDMNDMKPIRFDTIEEIFNSSNNIVEENGN